MKGENMKGTEKEGKVIGNIYENPELKEVLPHKCPACNSTNIMERKGICHDYHDIVCLDCGHKWKA